MHLLPEEQPKQKVNWLSVVTYYFLACAISWPFFWWRDMEPESWRLWDVPPYVKNWSYMWGPALAALVCFYLFRKTHQRRITFFGTSVLRSAAFFLLPMLLLTIPGLPGSDMNPHLYPLVYGSFAIIAYTGEELGWRGFLQDALRPLSPAKRYILIGILWEIWHFTNRMSQGEILQIIIRVSIFIVVAILLSVIFGEATDRGRSLLIAITLHTWVNLLAETDSISTWIVFGISIPIWGFLLWKWKDNAPQHPLRT